MKTTYILLFCTFFISNVRAQEEFIFPAYNGTPINLTASYSSVNDDIIITFMDADVLENFYTNDQNEIYLYGGLDTDSGSYQGAPDVINLVDQPVLTLVPSDSDNSASPNTYTLTLNLAGQYAAVANGTTVYGFDLYFQNQFANGGNNQTVDLYIDLVDALKDNTLGLEDFAVTPDLIITAGGITLKNIYGKYSVDVFNILGQKRFSTLGISDKDSLFLPLEFSRNQINLVKFESNDLTKTIKFISH